MKRCIIFLTVWMLIFLAGDTFATDWPVYKGNLYFTGNNDEITVKNNNLKWLFQADEAVYNPIVSDGKVYFTDLHKNVYCLDEDTGKPVWKISLRTYSSQFGSYARSAGKVKYPLIKGNKLFLTDSIAIYCLDKNTGKVIWARTGFREERKLKDFHKWDTSKSSKWQPGQEDKWDPSMASRGNVDFIYSNPVINNDLIYYGTRNLFISREIRNGHLQWGNNDIKSYSGFPSFYDDYIFTQSMDYGTGSFMVYCLHADSGKIKWKRKLTSPHKIYSPVVYRQRVYFASGENIFCLDLRTGAVVWEKNYGSIITSNPSFTERSVLFTLANRSVVMIDPDTGRIEKKVDLGEQSSPYFVTVRDQVYIASSFEKKVGNRKLPYTSLKSIKMSDSSEMWEFKSPFPGGPHQPVSSQGIMLQPAGNYMYAVGTDYYPRVIKGGSSVYDPYMKYEDTDKVPKVARLPRIEDKPVKKKPPKDKPVPLRKMKITVQDKKGKNVPAEVEVKKWHAGKVIYEKKVRVTSPSEIIEVPDLDDVEITASAPGYIPKKEIISRKDKKAIIELDQIEKGTSFIVENIYFEINEAYLLKESLNILDRMIESMNQNPQIRLEVRGHTDSTGTKEHNQKLSERRADAVIEYMIKNGISPERLKAVGFGETKPVDDNKTAEGRRKNRRTEFYVLDK